MSPRLQAIYHIRGDARSIEARARAIAVEQSVEMPLVGDRGRVRARRDRRPGRGASPKASTGLFEVRISLAAETVGGDPGQLINMLFGNTSLHDDVTLHDVALPAELVKALRRPPSRAA